MRVWPRRQGRPEGEAGPGGRREAEPHLRRKLATIPLIDVGSEGPPALVAQAPLQLDRLLRGCQRHYGVIVLRAGDAISRRWLDRSKNPYRGEIYTIARRIGRPGPTMLNLSFEWSCTSGVGPDIEGSGNRLLRTLDWPAPTLGSTIVVARQEGAAGPYYNVTWPGFVGVLTAMAPGRFSVAINQPPMLNVSHSLYLDWVIGHRTLWRAGGLPPAHLLRQVLDTCHDYDEALAALREAPICMPVFYSLSGIGPEQGCVIERLENRAVVHPAPTSISNHWRGISRPGHRRGEGSEIRWRAMEEVRDGSANDFSWVVPPIRNAATRVAVVANAAVGRLIVQGWEQEAPATEIFTLPARPTADRRNTTPGPPFPQPA
ncbi:MAG: hypothetical protein U1E66_11050 [Rhodospirillales bacterium]